MLVEHQSLIPVVMSGIIAVYGLVVSVLIAGGCESRFPSPPTPLDIDMQFALGIMQWIQHRIILCLPASFI